MADSTPNPVTAVPADSPRHPDRPARRTFSDREKLRILDAADRCSQPGELGLLLRREGLLVPLDLVEAVAATRVPPAPAEPDAAHRSGPPT